MNGDHNEWLKQRLKCMHSVAELCICFFLQCTNFIARNDTYVYHGAIGSVIVIQMFIRL